MAEDGDGVNHLLLVRETKDGDNQVELRSIADVVRAVTGNYQLGEESPVSSTSY